jgi:c(7)-type cytochrome triheme protein
MVRTILAMMFLLVCVSSVLAETGVKKKRPLPYEYGTEVMNNFSEKAGLAPVVFDHWLHRAKFTCRLCHVDLAFAMKAGATKIKAYDNISGYYCGACHNGKTVVDGVTVFRSCLRMNGLDDEKGCVHCHSLGKAINRT